jgi:hypothetical protein
MTDICFGGINLAIIFQLDFRIVQTVCNCVLFISLHQHNINICLIMWLYVLSYVLSCPYAKGWSSLPQVVCWRAHVLFTLFVFVYVQVCPTHIMLCFCTRDINMSRHSFWYNNILGKFWLIRRKHSLIYERQCDN